MTGPAQREALYDAFAQVGKAVSNGKRLELLGLLAQGERSVEALAHAAGLRLTSVSAHLQILKQAGLVTPRRDGVRVHYALAGDDVAALCGQLQQVARVHLAEAEHARAVYLGTTDTVPLTRQQLLGRMDSHSITVIDIRPVEEYTAGHIPGAVSVPLDELKACPVHRPTTRMSWSTAAAPIASCPTTPSVCSLLTATAHCDSSMASWNGVWHNCRSKSGSAVHQFRDGHDHARHRRRPAACGSGVRM